MRSYAVSTTINFEGSRFYVRSGDLVSYDAQRGSLAVYRNGGLVKVMKVTAIAIEAFVKSGFMSELRPAPKPKRQDPPPSALASLVKGGKGRKWPAPASALPDLPAGASAFLDYSLPPKTAS